MAARIAITMTFHRLLAALITVVALATVGTWLASRFMWWASGRSALWAMSVGTLLALVGLIAVVLLIGWIWTIATLGW
jgi:hypothetical protein